MSAPLLERSRPPVSVQDFTRDEIEGFLVQRLRGRVQAAWLFGSVADGSAGPWSDIDVLLVQDTDTAFPERALAFTDLFDLGVPVDVLVYTPAEFETLHASDSGFWKAFRQRNRQIL
ncbi:MAG: nucleotidyltransferase domain-containing protein [Chromatiales bacterium]|jgi:predicted nucleotidyltransferase|nr:nucleotidyltransferase domain-containing protein [Chromatiales bacterium]MDX9767955.1 nucleotidyltransferase domain-containing protein [Ectothiorhodospiraceae bacterium]